jgi:hypothetical protein
MAIQQVTAPAAADVSEGTLAEALTGYASMPFSAFSTTDIYVNKQDAGIAAAAYGVGGFLVGEAFGHKRERDGKKSFLPVMRG